MLRNLTFFTNKALYTTLTTKALSHNNVCSHQSLLQLAHEFEKKGEVRQAEHIYEKIISINPKCKEAYDCLMRSWISTRSLKVPEYKVQKFIKTYEDNFATCNSIIMKPNKTS